MPSDEISCLPLILFAQLLSVIYVTQLFKLCTKVNNVALLVVMVNLYFKVFCYEITWQVRRFIELYISPLINFIFMPINLYSQSCEKARVSAEIQLKFLETILFIRSTCCFCFHLSLRLKPFLSVLTLFFYNIQHFYCVKLHFEGCYACKTNYFLTKPKFRFVQKYS